MSCTFTAQLAFSLCGWFRPSRPLANYGHRLAMKLSLLPCSSSTDKASLAPQPCIASLRPIRPQLLEVGACFFCPLIIILLISGIFQYLRHHCRRALAWQHLALSCSHALLPARLFGASASFTAYCATCALRASRAPQSVLEPVASVQVFFPALSFRFIRRLEAVFRVIVSSRLVVLGARSANRCSLAHQCPQPTRYRSLAAY